MNEEHQDPLSWEPWMVGTETAPWRGKDSLVSALTCLVSVPLSLVKRGQESVSFPLSWPYSLGCSKKESRGGTGS